MKYEEVHRDLFTVDESYNLVHCIASDLKMSAGIAVDMQRKFHLRGKIEKSGESLKHPNCIFAGEVFNLITKKKSSGKPTLESLDKAIKKMKSLIQYHEIKKIAMPKIGCGLDKLSWGEVRECIHSTFDSIDIEILVCTWK